MTTLYLRARKDPRIEVGRKDERRGLGDKGMGTSDEGKLDFTCFC